MSDLTPFLLCGPAAEIVVGFAERRKAAGVAWRSYAEARGGDPEKVLHSGFSLSGVKFDAPPKGWVRASKKYPGYWKPRKNSPDWAEFAAVLTCDFHPWKILTALKISFIVRMGLTWDGGTPILHLEGETWPAGAVPAGFRLDRSEAMRIKEGKPLTGEVAAAWAAFVAEHGAAEVSVG